MKNMIEASHFLFSNYWFLIQWEKVDKKYLGLIAKLMFSCSKANDNPETGCFVFKSEGNQSLGELNCLSIPEYREIESSVESDPCK